MENDELNHILSGVSEKAVRFWLKQKELNQSGKQLDDLVKALLETKLLKEDEFKDAIIGIEEYGGKRIYLRKLTNLAFVKDENNFFENLKRLGIQPLNNQRNLAIKNPSIPKLIYCICSKDEIRIKFSESHKRVIVKKVERRFEEEIVTRIIVISVERKTGFCKIMLDPPGDENPRSRENPEESYVGYYFTKTTELIGEHIQSPFYKKLEGVLNEKEPTFQIKRDKGKTKYAEFDFKSEDLLKDETYNESLAKNRLEAHNQVNGEWLKEKSEKKLARNLYTVIKPNEGFIQVFADCLEGEAEYVISRIK